MNWGVKTWHKPPFFDKIRQKISKTSNLSDGNWLIMSFKVQKWNQHPNKHINRGLDCKIEQEYD